MPKRSSDKDNLAFHLDLLKQIPYHCKITARELHQQMLALGYLKSLRAVQRMLVKLIEEYEIECDNRAKPYGYRRLGRLPVTQSLTNTQAVFIKIATERLQKSVPANLISAMKPIVEQADFVLKYGNRQSRENVWLHNLQMNKIYPDISESLSAELSSQIYQQKQVTLYSPILFSKLTVSPLGLLHTAFSIYLIAYISGYIKAFDLRYISKIQPLSITAEYPKRFNLSEYKSSATQFDTPVIILSSSHQTEENIMMSNQELIGFSTYLQSEEDRSARVHIIAKGSFGKNVMGSIALPDNEMLSVEFLEEQQVSQYENEKLDLLLVITDEFDWLFLQDYQNVEIQMIVGSRPYRGLIKPLSCFVYGQPIAQYRSMIQNILGALFKPGLIAIDCDDLRKLVEKGGTGVVASSFRGGDANSSRAEDVAQSVLVQLQADSMNLQHLQGCLINIIANDDLELNEVQTLMDRLMESTNPDSLILIGTTLDERVEGIQVNLLAIM